MSKFDRIIGYSAIKRELRQIADILKNRDAYDKLGAVAPRGLLLYGPPGVGKSLMAAAVIEESGRRVFVCRKDRPDGDFVKEIKATFDKAVANAPAIVYLDDMDKFANGDEDHLDAEEYVTVQSCMDEARGNAVFVLATANSIRCLPHSLRRAGRFDRLIKVDVPWGADAVKITAHFLEGKKVVRDVDPETIARILDGRSCAELETVINEAGLYAGYERAEFITMDHLMKACMRVVFGVLPCEDACTGDLSDPANVASQVVYHEAGHAVVSEVLCPESVTIVSVHKRGKDMCGFTAYCTDGRLTPLYQVKSHIVRSLGGMAAVEQRFGILDCGSSEDLERAFAHTDKLVTEMCMSGLHLHGSDFGYTSHLQSQQEQVVSAEVEKFYRKAKEIIALNREFFEKVAAALGEKHMLSALDMKAIKAECKIVSVDL